MASMAASLHAPDGTPIGGWMLRGDRTTFDVWPMLEQYGQIYRYPVPAGPRAELMGPGQPCFLFLTDTSRVVGLWAVGEVVAPVLEVPADPDSVPDSADGAGRLLAEVEMLPLRKAIAEGTLRKDPALARSELFTAPEQANPLVLEPQAVRAIEGFELELVPPSAEQVERLDALLAAEDADHL